MKSIKFFEDQAKARAKEVGDNWDELGEVKQELVTAYFIKTYYEENPKEREEILNS